MSDKTIVNIGNIRLGGALPVVVQTMTNTATTDIEGTIEQTIRVIDKGAEMVRITVPTLKEIDIKEAVNLHFRDIGQNPEKHDVTYENGHARERTQILMDLANQSGGMVIVTGDLSELALGWATYNGDHMSMYGVNVGVPKTLLRHLVAYCANPCSESETVLPEVLMDLLVTSVST